MQYIKRFSTLHLFEFKSIISSIKVRNRGYCSIKKMNNENERTTSFGFQTVKESEKADKGMPY